MHIPGRFCYLCNEKEAKQKKKSKDNRLPGFHVQSMYIECYVVYGSKIIILFENLFPGLTGSGAENYSIQYYQLHNCILEFANILYYLSD